MHTPELGFGDRLGEGPAAGLMHRITRSARTDQAGLVRQDHRLDPIAQVEFRQDAVHVVFTVVSAITSWPAMSALLRRGQP